jgi:hypothetical protein
MNRGINYLQEEQNLTKSPEYSSLNKTGRKGFHETKQNSMKSALRFKRMETELVKN